MKTDSASSFSEAYFREECAHLIKMMGERSFWEKGTDTCRDALRGLTYVYFNLWNEDGTKPTDEQIKKWADQWFTLAEEFNRRSYLVFSKPS